MIKVSIKVVEEDQRLAGVDGRRGNDVSYCTHLTCEVVIVVLRWLITVIYLSLILCFAFSGLAFSSFGCLSVATGAAIPRMTESNSKGKILCATILARISADSLAEAVPRKPL